MKYFSLRRLPSTILITLFPLLIFSYYPVISLGIAFGVHLDFSLLYALLVITLLINLPALWHERRTLLASPAWKLGILLLLYIWLSTLWSTNPFRAVATAGFFTLVLGIFSTVIIHIPILMKQKQTIIQYTTYSFLFAGALALWQIVCDGLQFAPELSLLPAMYGGDTFGIARPTAFSLEPQLFGSLLLIPFIYTGYRFLQHTAKSDLLLFGMSSVLLSLTLSRGALLSAALGLILLIALLRPSWKSTAKLLVTGFTSIIITLGFITAVGGLRNDSISGYDTMRNVISQLTLGTISLPEKVRAPSTDVSVSNETTKPIYIESSTNSRISMSNEALRLWKNSPATILFGVGIGGFGTSLHATNAEFSTSSVVNNFHLELLAETGIVGMLLFISFISTLIYNGIKKRQFALLALLLAFVIQWCFFSGTSNVVHIWIILGLLAAVSLRPLKNTSIHKRI